MQNWKQFRDTTYEISVDGFLRNRHGRFLKPIKVGIYKYQSYIIKINGKQKNIFIHRMVAETFIPNPDGKKQVNHKDGNKLNNSVENLEWMTRAENIQHSYDTGLKTYKPLHYKGRFGSDHNRSIKVKCIETGEEFGSMSEAGRNLNISPSSVHWSVKHQKPIYGMRFEVAK